MTLLVLLVELGMRHHDAVPRGVVGDHVDDHFHLPLMGFLHKPPQIVLGAVRRVDRVVVANGIRAAQRALLLDLSVRVNGHQPKDIHVEVLSSSRRLVTPFRFPSGEKERVNIW